MTNAAGFEQGALSFTQSGRKGWVTKLAVKDLAEMAPKREPEQLSLLTETNRPITPKHLGGIEKFLLETPGWAFPAIVLSVSPGKLQGSCNTVGGSFVDLGILDGQHRVQAFSNVLHELEINSPRDESGETGRKLDCLRQEEIPVIVFEVADNREHRQLFAWFARQRPIEPAVRDYFDNSDPFGNVAKEAMERSAVLTGRVTWKSSSVPVKGEESYKLLSLKDLKEVVSAIRVGVGRAPTQGQKDVCREKEAREGLLALTCEFFDEFLPGCLPNYLVLDNLSGFRGRVKGERALSYCLAPEFLRLAANAWARYKLDRKEDTGKLMPVIGTLNLRQADPNNELEGALAVLTGGARRKFEKLRSKAWEMATIELMRRAQAVA